MWTIGELKSKANQSLGRDYWKAVFAAFIYGLVASGSAGGSAGSSIQSASSELAEAITGLSSGDYFAAVMSVISAAMVTIVMLLIFSSAIAILFQLFLCNPLKAGCYRYFLVAGFSEANLNEIGYAFKGKKYMNAVKVMFFMDLYIFLWGLLFVIPGIIKSYEYRMVPYLLAENGDIDMDTAFELSKKMMTGEKMRAFILDLSFIGWYILTAFTCGILSVFYVTPYKQFTDAELYMALRNKVA